MVREEDGQSSSTGRNHFGIQSGLGQESVWGLGLGFSLLSVNVVKITMPLATRSWMNNFLNYLVTERYRIWTHILENGSHGLKS